MDSETEEFLAALCKHGKVIEAESENIDLPPGVTHILITSENPPRLIRKRSGG